MEMYLVVRTVLTGVGALGLQVLCKEHSRKEYYWIGWAQVRDGYYPLTMFTWEDAQGEVQSRGGDSVLTAVPVDREYLERVNGG